MKFSQLKPYLVELGEDSRQTAYRVDDRFILTVRTQGATIVCGVYGEDFFAVVNRIEVTHGGVEPDYPGSTHQYVRHPIIGFFYMAGNDRRGAYFGGLLVDDIDVDIRVYERIPSWLFS